MCYCVEGRRLDGGVQVARLHVPGQGAVGGCLSSISIPGARTGMEIEDRLDGVLVAGIAVW